MASPLLQGILVIGILWLLWRALRPYITKSSLDNIPGPRSTSILKGNLQHLFSPDSWDFHENISDTYGPVVKFTGMFGSKALYVFDPQSLHHIVVKDQYIYERASFQIALNRVILGYGILSTTGDHHRRQRRILNPVFSIRHMRLITPVFYQTMHRLRKALTCQVQNSEREINMLSWMGRAALELVGQGGLGYSFDPLLADMKDSYGDALKHLQPALSKGFIWRVLSPYYTIFGPAPFRRFLSNLVPDTNFRVMKTLADTMDRRSREIFCSKKSALLAGDEAVSQQIAQGKDIMSVLFQANMEASEGDKLPEDEIVAQMSTLVIAAMDTTSNALARIMQLLALHPEVQKKLRQEIVFARNGQDISYDKLVELPYLEAVCRETLRVYPPVSVTWRNTVKDVILPFSKPIRGLDGSLMNEVVVPKGTLIAVGNRSCNRNKAIWGADAREWKPERWLQPLPEAVKEARIPGVYSNLMTFIGGSRACIGFKFSQLEMKVVLSVLLEAFEFSPSDKDVKWNMSNVSYPSVSPSDTKPAMPLRVKSIKRD